jgi:hypothetical protein
MPSKLLDLTETPIGMRLWTAFSRPLIGKKWKIGMVLTGLTTLKIRIFKVAFVQYFHNEKQPGSLAASHSPFPANSAVQFINQRIFCMHLIQLKIVGIVVLAIGILIWYNINRNRFNRRNAAGLQQFRSYEQSWGTRYAEGIGKIIAIFMVLGGGSILLLNC